MNKKSYERLLCEVEILEKKDVLFLSAFDNDTESGGGFDW